MTRRRFMRIQTWSRWFAVKLGAAQSLRCHGPATRLSPNAPTRSRGASCFQIPGTLEYAQRIRSAVKLREGFLQIGDLWQIVVHDVRLGRMRVEVVLVILLRAIKSLQRGDLCDDLTRIYLRSVELLH